VKIVWREGDFGCRHYNCGLRIADCEFGIAEAVLAAVGGFERLSMALRVIPPQNGENEEPKKRISVTSVSSCSIITWQAFQAWMRRPTMRGMGFQRLSAESRYGVNHSFPDYRAAL
jgi:hypothetical protein